MQVCRRGWRVQVCLALALTCFTVLVHAQPAAGVLESDSQWWQGWHEMRRPAVTREQMNVTAVAGQTAALPCKVMNLGDRTVSWIRMASAAEPPATPETERHDPVENGNPVSSPPLPAIKLEPEVKLEVEEVNDKSRTFSSMPHSPSEETSKAEATSNGGTTSTNGPDIQRYCKACNITFSFTDSFLAHKRFYCTKPESTTPPETAVQ